MQSGTLLWNLYVVFEQSKYENGLALYRQPKLTATLISLAAYALISSAAYAKMLADVF